MNATQLVEKAQELEFADNKVIHLWHRTDHAVCGSIKTNHNCRKFNGQFIWADFSTDTCCPGCSKPLCPYCALLVVPPV